MALLLLNVISIVHTHQSEIGTCQGLALASGPGADRCVACEMLAKGTGNTTITPVYVLTACRSIVFAIHSTASVLRDTVVLSSSSRAPPIG